MYEQFYLKSVIIILIPCSPLCPMSAGQFQKPLLKEVPFDPLVIHWNSITSD